MPSGDQSDIFQVLQQKIVFTVQIICPHQNQGRNFLLLQHIERFCFKNYFFQGIIVGFPAVLNAIDYDCIRLDRIYKWTV